MVAWLLVTAIVAVLPVFAATYNAASVALGAYAAVDVKTPVRHTLELLRHDFVWQVAVHAHSRVQ